MGGGSSKNGENYCILPSGMKLCWGQGTARSVSFPVDYDSAPQVVVTPIKSTKDNGYLIAAFLVGVTATGFSYKLKYTHTTYANDGGEASEPCTWMAVGY